ncbi:MAG TPA: hypothetical protein VJ821_10230 [Anaerolineales bacterium]|nr:hypothetical protein [Anaerolineales bacterium]
MGSVEPTVGSRQDQVFVNTVEESELIEEESMPDARVTRRDFLKLSGQLILLMLGGAY